MDEPRSAGWIYAPGLKLDAATASAANEAYQEVAKLDRLIANAIENAQTCSVWLRDKGGHPIGWDGIVASSDLGGELRGIVLRHLYAKRAPWALRLKQLGFHVMEAPR